MSLIDTLVHRHQAEKEQILCFYYKNLIFIFNFFQKEYKTKKHHRKLQSTIHKFIYIH